MSLCLSNYENHRLGLIPCFHLRFSKMTPLSDYQIFEVILYEKVLQYNCLAGQELLREISQLFHLVVRVRQYDYGSSLVS